MNGKELYYNLIDELERARELLEDDYVGNGDLIDPYAELITDINADLERCYDNQDVLCEVLKEIEVE